MIARNVLTRARVEGLVVLALALGYLWEARTVPSLYQMPGVPGPTAFPALIGIVLAASGLWRLARGAGREGPPAQEPAVAAPAAGREGPPAQEPAVAAPAAGSGGWLPAGRRFYAMWGVVLAYLALMPALGFPVATVAALAALFLLLGERRVAVAVGLSLAVTAILHLGFAKGLGVQLPLGVLAPLVK